MTTSDIHRTIEQKPNQLSEMMEEKKHQRRLPCHADTLEQKEVIRRAARRARQTMSDYILVATMERVKRDQLAHERDHFVLEELTK